MLSGGLSQENLTQVLRELSQKKRHGILQVITKNKKLEIVFSAGRIVDCQLEGEIKTQALRRRVVELGLLPKEALDMPLPESYQGLFALIKSHTASITQDDFKELLKHWVQDQLYSINPEDAGHFGFSLKVPDFERSFAASISVGQLLLDMVALKGEFAQFDQIIPASVYLLRTAETGSDLSPDEELLFAAIGKGIKHATLRKRIYLSEYPFRESMFSLREKGLIDLSLTPPDGELSVLENRIDPEPVILSERDAQVEDKRAPRQSLIARVNQFMLQSSIAPEILVIALLGSALVVPLLLWKETFLQF